MLDAPGGGGYMPMRCRTSGRLTPAAATLITTSPGRGSGMGTSAATRTSGPPGSRIMIVFISLSPCVRHAQTGPSCLPQLKTLLLAPAYPGQGDATGTPSTTFLIRDLDAAFFCANVQLNTSRHSGFRNLTAAMMGSNRFF